MEGESSKTPYNTIYATLKKKNQEDEIQCCTHGTNCAYGRGKREVKPDNNQYVSLGSPGKKENEVASKLTERLNKLAEKEEEPCGKREMMSLNTLMVPNEGQPKKNKKKSKKEPVLVDDTQSYVMLGPSSDDQTAQTAPDPPAIENPTGNLVETIVGESVSAYIGVCTLLEAENHLTRRGEFGLYHLFNLSNRLDTLTETLPLMLVYRTTTKKTRHYSIRVTSDRLYFVDCGYPNVRKHCSLNQLVMFYKTSAMCEINANDTSADSFSWWLE